jgi:hypothetical protein
MHAYRFLFTSCVALTCLVVGCSGLKCPKGYTKYGDQCRKCKPGEEREHGQCVPIRDGSVEAVEEDPEEPFTDAAVSPDPNDSLEEGEPTDAPEEAEDASAPDASQDAASSALCYRDQDGDGAGAGEPLSCTQTDTGKLSSNNADCDDNDPARSPSLSDVCGDRIDNDCDGMPDDEANNACGGPCGTQLGHQPGEPCSNGLKGACLKSGTYACQGTTATACNAPMPAPMGETCGDRIDNDCDGAIDEDDATDATVWYEDCDGDGYSGLSDALITSGIGIRRACIKPSASPECSGGWTIRRPIAGLSWDCDDATTAYHPAADFGVPPPGKTRIDLNCDGRDEKESAFAVPNSLFPELGLVSYPLCDASATCIVCGTGPDGLERAAGQWLSSSNQPTNVQPRCSRDLNDKFDYRMTYTFTGGTCPNGSWFISPGPQGLQRCR